MTLLGIMFKASYLLRRHELSGAPVDRWLLFLLVMLAGLAAVGLVPGGAGSVLLCAALALLLVALQAWAGRCNYLVFRPDKTMAPRMRPVSLPPSNSLPVRATGLFEVEGKAQRFTELPATYRSFSTREHALMAVVPPSRLLGGLVKWPEHEIGMWYIFVKSGELRQVEPGTVSFGRAKRPALRLLAEQVLPDNNGVMDAWGLQWGKDRSQRKTRQQTIYLSFNGEAERALVMADLLVDG